MAGIYFKLSHDPNIDNGKPAPDNEGSDTVELTGYVRAGGSLKILGLVTLSLEFYLSLTYVSPPHPGKTTGEASMTVKIEVACFSASKTLTVRKQFGGHGGDPTMAQMITQGQYNEYCGAFG
jgi:hypothetical protein